MSEQSVAFNVYELFDQQVKLSRSIGMTRSAQRNVNISVYERRLERLNLNWDKFQSNHRLILRVATEIDRNHKYFRCNFNTSTEKKYQQSREYVYLMLEGLKTTEQRTVQMQTQQPLTDTVVRSTTAPQDVAPKDTRPVWDGVLEWNSPINVRNGSEQKQLRKVQCRISVNFRDGEPEIDTAPWERTLKLGFMVKQKNTNLSKNSTTLSLDLAGPNPADENWKSLQVAALIGTVPFTHVPSATGGTRKLIFDYSGSTQKFVGYILNDQSLNRQCLAGTVPSTSTQADRPNNKPGIVKDIILPPSSTVTVVRSSTGPGTSGIGNPVAGSTANVPPIGPSAQTPNSQDDGTNAEKRSSNDIIITNVIKRQNSSEIQLPSQSLDSSHAVGEPPRRAAKDVERTETSIRQTQAGRAPSTWTEAATPQPGIVSDISPPSLSNATVVRGNTGPGSSGIEISVAGSTENNSPNCASVRSLKSQDDGTRAKESSSDDIIITDVIIRQNSSEIREPCQTLNLTPAVGDHPQTAVKDPERTEASIPQIQEDTVPVDAVRDALPSVNVSQDKSHVSATNCAVINRNEGADNREKETNKQNSVVDTTTISPAQPKQKSETPKRQDQKRPEAAGGSSPESTLESARKLNQQQIEALEKAMEAAKEKEAYLQQALQTVRQEKTDIGQSLASARKQEMKYKRQGKKCDVNDIKVKYQRRSNCHSRET